MSMEDNKQKESEYQIIEIYPSNRHYTSEPITFVFENEFEAKEFTYKMIAIGIDNHRIETKMLYKQQMERL